MPEHMTPEMLIDKMSLVYEFCYPKHTAIAMLRIVLEEIQRGGVVKFSVDVKNEKKLYVFGDIVLKPEFKKFLEDKK